MRRDPASYLATRGMIVNVPLPQQTNTYKPVGHERIIDLTMNGIIKAGFNVEKEMYFTAKEGMVANGRYFIKDVADSEMQLQVVWQNSYDKSKVLSFAVGANVLVCTNGMMAFRGITSFKKKHVGQIQTFAPNTIPEYIKMAGELFTTLQSERDAMKQVPLTRRLTAELLGRLYIEEKIVESTQLNIIKRELSKPTFDYGSEGSLWELYQFTTFAIGGIHPSSWMDDHLRTHEFFVNYANDFRGVETVEDAHLIEVDDPRQLKLFDV